MGTGKNVIRMEDILNQNKENSNSAVPENKPETEVKKTVQQIPRGKPKSGRIWKEQKQRFSSIVKTRGIRLSLEKKRKLKEDLKRAQEMSRAIKAQKQQEKEDKKERRRANLKRAAENQRKSEIVQVITNTAKLKRMKKKQLRMIEKRDTLKLQKS